MSHPQHKQPDYQKQLNEYWSTLYNVPKLPDRDTLDLWLSKTKGQLLMFKKRTGFLGSLLCSHNFVWDETCDTAWCNGQTIGWNPWFFTGCTTEGRMFVVGHELWHTGYDHMGRLGNRDPGLFNIAADHVINLGAKDDGFKFTPEHLAGIEVYADPRFVSMSTEQIYDILQDEQPPADSGKNSFSTGDNDPRSVKQMAGDLRDPVKTEYERVATVVRAAQAESQQPNPGKVPGEITNLIDKFLNPILPWSTILRNQLTELSRDDTSWRTPSRRNQDFYLPSKLGENGLEHGLFCTDVSGSISDPDMLRSNSEAKGIYDEFSPERLTLITFDTQIQNVVDLYKDDPFDSLEITGRGGTDLYLVYEYAINLNPSVMVIFTDLWVDVPPNPGIPVIWIVIGRGDSLSDDEKPSYGKIIMMPPEPT